MKCQDNFCGTMSMAKVARARGHICITLDNNPKFNADIVADILYVDPGLCEYAHFSPSCTGFSVASFGTHWGGGYRAYIPKTDTAKMGLLLLNRIAELIARHKYKYWTVENPVGMFRKLFPDILKKHGIIDFKIVKITYCQYGEKRMKPTDFITNISDWTGKCCKNGSSCHERAPRGSKTGTQGLKNAEERGKIPASVFEEIFSIIEEGDS